MSTAKFDIETNTSKRPLEAQKVQAGLAFMQPQIMCDSKAISHIDSKGQLMCIAPRDQEESSVVNVLPVRPKEATSVFCSELGNYGLHKSIHWVSAGVDTRAMQHADN